MIRLFLFYVALYLRLFAPTLKLGIFLMQCVVNISGDKKSIMNWSVRVAVVASHLFWRRHGWVSNYIRWRVRCRYTRRDWEYGPYTMMSGNSWKLPTMWIHMHIQHVSIHCVCIKIYTYKVMHRTMSEWEDRREE